MASEASLRMALKSVWNNDRHTTPVREGSRAHLQSNILTRRRKHAKLYSRKICLRRWRRSQVQEIACSQSTFSPESSICFSWGAASENRLAIFEGKNGGSI